MAESKTLSPEIAKFVELVCQGASQKDAAIGAGVPEKYASSKAWKFMQMIKVKEAIDAYNSKMLKKLEDIAEYTAVVASAEIDNALAFAYRTNSPTAYVRAIELRMKLRGLLDKDKGADATGFSINIMGLAPPQATKDVTPTEGSIYE